MTTGGRPSGRAWRALVTLASALSLVALSGAGWAGAQNDAGSGTDAPDSAQYALHLPGYGSYEGNLTGSDQSDWYKWRVWDGSIVCQEADITTQTIVDAHLVAVEDSAVSEAFAQILLSRATQIGVVTPGVDGGYLAVSADPLAPGITDDYHFQVHSLSSSWLPPGDAGAGWGVDAPNGTSGALPAPGACFGGHVGGAADPADTYSFAAQAGDHVMISLGDTAATATAKVTDAAGNVLATIGTDGVTSLTLPTSGTYFMTASAAAPTTYVFGLCDPQCGPPGAPCNPMCLVSFNN